MHVGLFAGKQSGGGFTYETEILAALSKLACQSRHEFTFMVPSVEDCNILEPYIDANYINLVVVPKSTKPVMKNRSLQNLILLTTNKLLGRRDKVRKLHADDLEKFVRANGIQIIWFIDQTYGMVTDMPYLATSWDLQHRLQPFFPEVNERGIWDRREQGISRYLQRATMVIAGSQVLCSDIERFYGVPANRIKILPLPTPNFALNPPELDDQAVLEKYEISSGYLFYPAQFWSHKNHINLLLALNLLREKYGMNLKMVFVGSDHGNGAYVKQKIQELNLAVQVNILGFVPQSDLVALYRQALALTFVTFFGPDNLPPLEAFALGCPVIASSVLGAQEQLGNAALLVDPANPEEIALAIRKLYKTPTLRASLIRRGKQRALKWTSEDFVKGVFEILDEFEPFRRTWA